MLPLCTLGTQLHLHALLAGQPCIKRLEPPVLRSDALSCLLWVSQLNNSCLWSVGEVCSESSLQGLSWFYMIMQVYRYAGSAVCVCPGTRTG